MDKNPQEVAAMFDGVARRYDIVNDILSLGRTKAWRKAATKVIAPAPGMKILDMAAGTGSSSAPLAAAGADVIAAERQVDFRALGRIDEYPRERKTRQPRDVTCERGCLRGIADAAALAAGVALDQHVHCRRVKPRQGAGVAVGDNDTVAHQGEPAAGGQGAQPRVLGHTHHGVRDEHILDARSRHAFSFA